MLGNVSFTNIVQTQRNSKRQN